MTPPALLSRPRLAVPLRCPGARPLRVERLLHAARRRATRAEFQGPPALHVPPARPRPPLTLCHVRRERCSTD